MKKINRQFIISLLVCLVPLIMGAVFYNRLPGQVAIHFAADGTPDNFASKAFALFAIPLFLLVIHLIVWIQMENDPKRRNYSKVMRGIAFWMVPVIGVAVQAAVISYGMGYPMNMGFYVALGLGVLMMVMGNYLPKCRQNYTMGIKLPWTLHDEDNWNRTHRLAGWVWLGGGALLVVNAFLNLPWATVGIILLMVLIPSVYSFLLYRKKKSGESGQAAG